MKKLSGKDKLGLGLGTLAVVSVAIAVIPGAMVAVADTCKKIVEKAESKKEK